MLALIVLTILIFYYIEPIIARQKLKNNNEHGSARWATKKEIKKTFTKEKVSSINEVGFPIYFSKFNKYVWFDKETPHWCFLGSSGSGKSSTSVIPQCSFIATAKNKRSVFITDPKGEIFSKTSQMFADNGYKIITLDFRNPSLSDRINLLEPCILEYEEYLKCLELIKKLDDELFNIKNREDILDADNNYLKNNLIDYRKKNKYFNYKKYLNHYNTKKNNLTILKNKINNEKNITNNNATKHYAESMRLSNSISTMLTADKSNQDPFWNNSAKDLLDGLINFFLEEYAKKKIDRNQINLSNIKRFQNSTMIEGNDTMFLEYIEQKPYGSKSKDKIIPLLSSGENTYKSIVSVFNEKMSLFDDVNVENITSYSDFSFNELGKKLVALFFIIPDEEKIYYKLVSTIIGCIYKELVKLANSTKDKKLPVDLELILDEIANCPPIMDIDNIVSVARSRGIHINFYIQSFNQFYNVYGKDVSQTILDNCGLAYLKTNTEDTAEAVSKRLGVTTIESNSLSYSLGLSSSNGSRGTNLIARPLMTADEIKQLHFKMIIFPVKGHPILRDTIFYKKFHIYKDGIYERKTRNNHINKKYYTVEDINNSGLEKVLDYDKINQKQLLEELLGKISEELINIKYVVDFKPKEDSLIMSLNFLNPLSSLKLLKVIEQINQDVFEFQVFSSDDINEKFATIIEIRMHQK